MRLLQVNEIESVYKPLFKEIFGYYDENHIPRTVILHEVDGLPVGFVAGYMFLKDTFYMQYGGVTGAFTGHKKFWADGESWLIDQGVKHLITVVENTNTTWQRVLLKMGFIAHGMKVNQGKIYLDYWKPLERGIDDAAGNTQ